MNQEYSQDLQNSKKLNTINNVDMDYHPLQTQIYPANFNYSEFEKYKFSEFNRMSEDSCFNKRKDNDNDKKLKFMTTNYVDILEGKDKLNFFGYSIKDGLNVPGERIDNYSDLLNGKTGGQITNEKWKNSLGQLPLLTTPYRGQLQHGDVIKEDSIRNYIEPKKNSCLPKGTDFEQRSFAIFDDAQGIEVPNANKSVEQHDNGFHLGRNGVSSRFQNRFESQQKIKSVGDLNVIAYNNNRY